MMTKTVLPLPCPDPEHVAAFRVLLLRNATRPRRLATLWTKLRVGVLTDRMDIARAAGADEVLVQEIRDTFASY